MTENRLLLVDGHAVAFHCWYSEYPHSVISGFEQMLDEAIERNNASHLIVAFDPAPPTFRHDMWPQYKAGRPPVPARFLKECETVKINLDEISEFVGLNISVASVIFKLLEKKC